MRRNLTETKNMAVFASNVLRTISPEARLQLWQIFVYTAPGQSMQFRGINAMSSSHQSSNQKKIKNKKTRDRKVLSYVLLCGRVVDGKFYLWEVPASTIPSGIQVCDLGDLVIALQISIHGLKLVPATAWVSI